MIFVSDNTYSIAESHVDKIMWYANVTDPHGKMESLGFPFLSRADARP
jgi:hypothetical protein